MVILIHHLSYLSIAIWSKEMKHLVRIMSLLYQHFYVNITEYIFDISFFSFLLQKFIDITQIVSICFRFEYKANIASTMFLKFSLCSVNFTLSGMLNIQLKKRKFGGKF